MNQHRPAWLPTLSELERQCVGALVATLVVALVLNHWPEGRAIVRKAFGS